MTPTARTKATTLLKKRKASPQVSHAPKRTNTRVGGTLSLTRVAAGATSLSTGRITCHGARNLETKKSMIIELTPSPSSDSEASSIVKLNGAHFNSESESEQDESTNIATKRQKRDSRDKV